MRKTLPFGGKTPFQEGEVKAVKGQALLTQSFVCWAWLAQPGLGSYQLPGLILSCKSLQRTGWGLFLCCKPVSDPGGALGIAQHWAGGGGVCLFHCWGISGWQILLAQALGLQLCVRTESHQEGSLLHPPHCSMSHTFTTAVVNQCWQIRRDYAEIVGVGWVITSFICTW